MQRLRTQVNLSIERICWRKCEATLANNVRPTKFDLFKFFLPKSDRPARPNRMACARRMARRCATVLESVVRGPQDLSKVRIETHDQYSYGLADVLKIIKYKPLVSVFHVNYAWGPLGGAMQPRRKSKRVCAHATILVMTTPLHFLASGRKGEGLCVIKRIAAPWYSSTVFSSSAVSCLYYIFKTCVWVFRNCLGVQNVGPHHGPHA